MHRLLSSDISFHDHIRIETAQVYAQVTRWVRGEDVKQLTTDRRHAVSGDPSAWTDVFIISMRLGDPEGYLDALRRSREERHDFLTQVFGRWRVES